MARNKYQAAKRDILAALRTHMWTPEQALMQHASCPLPPTPSSMVADPSLPIPTTVTTTATTTTATMPASQLESLPQEIREHIYFYLGFPIAGKCIHNCANQTCRPDIDTSIPRHPRAKPHYVDIWDEWMRCGGAGLKLLNVRKMDARSGKVEGVDIFIYPAVCALLFPWRVGGLCVCVYGSRLM
jgi:hypothetical protein